MKNKIAIILSFLLLVSAVPLRAEGQNGEPPNYVGEAGKAVIGRVFGVQGEGGNIDYHEVEFSKVAPINSAVRSALIPGWGQQFNRQKVKGTLFFVTFVTSTFGAIHLYSKSQDSYDEYKARGLKDDALFNDYEDQRAQAEVLGGFALLLWAFSITDAYRNAYNPLYSQRVHMELAANTDGPEVRVTKRF